VKLNKKELQNILVEMSKLKRVSDKDMHGCVQVKASNDKSTCAFSFVGVYTNLSCAVKLLDGLSERSFKKYIPLTEFRLVLGTKGGKSDSVEIKFSKTKAKVFVYDEEDKEQASFKINLVKKEDVSFKFSKAEISWGDSLEQDIFSLSRSTKFVKTVMPDNPLASNISGMFFEPRDGNVVCVNQTQAKLGHIDVGDMDSFFVVPDGAKSLTRISGAATTRGMETCHLFTSKPLDKEKSQYVRFLFSNVDADVFWDLKTTLSSCTFAPYKDILLEKNPSIKAPSVEFARAIELYKSIDANAILFKLSVEKKCLVMASCETEVLISAEVPMEFEELPGSQKVFAINPSLLSEALGSKKEMGEEISITFDKGNRYAPIRIDLEKQGLFSLTSPFRLEKQILDSPLN